MIQRLLRIDPIFLLLTVSCAVTSSNASAQSQPMIPVTPKPGSTGTTYTQVAQSTPPPIVASGTQTNTQGNNAWRAIPPSGAGYRVAANPAGFYQQPAFDGFAVQNQPGFGMINTGPVYQVAQVPQQFPQTAPVYVPQSYVAPNVQPYYGANPAQYGVNTFQPQWTGQLNYLYMTRVKSNSFPLLIDGGGGTKFDAEQLDYGAKGGFDVALSRRMGPNSNFEVRYFQLRDLTALGSSPIVGGDAIVTVPVTTLFFPGTIDYVADSNLNSLEFNWVGGTPVSQRVRLAMGFRYVGVSENLLQTLTTGFVDSALDIDTNNHMYGFQIASDGVLFNTGCFSMAGWIKAGVYANYNDQSTLFGPVAGPPTIYSEISRTTTSFLGELGLVADWSIFQNVSLVGGYQILYIAGAALAPDQLQHMSSIGTGLVPSVLDQSDPVYHGALFGIDIHW